MTEVRLVNALMESLYNAPGPKEEAQAVGRQLNDCLQCVHWGRGCIHQTYQQWIEQLITPGERCDRV